jgi:cysteinyl-tRNA synthetase
LARLYTALEAAAIQPGLVAEGTEFEVKFNEAMDDDFNTPQAMAVLFELVKEVNKTKQSGLVALLQSLANRLGLLTENPETFFKSQVGQPKGLTDEAIDALIVERAQARADKNWARSDEIRDELLAKGIELLDSKEGTSWRSV